MEHRSRRRGNRDPRPTALATDVAHDNRKAREVDGKALSLGKPTYHLARGLVPTELSVPVALLIGLNGHLLWSW